MIRVGTSRLFLVVACLSLAACVTQPTSFSKGSSIALDSFNVVVTSKESVVSGTKQNVVVHFRTSGINNRDDLTRFFDRFGRRMKMIDRDGKEYDALPFTLNYYRSHQSTPLDNPAMSPMFTDLGNLRDWVAVAQAPANSKGFSLHIDNPMPRPGQAEAALIEVDK